MPSQDDVNRLRQAQAAIRALVERDLEALFWSLNLDNAEAAAAQLRMFIPELVRQYGEAAATMAADWYDEVRAAEGVPGRFRAAMAPSPYQDAAEGLARRAAGALFTAAQADALTTLLPSVGKYALAAGRDTIATSTHRDPRAVGWQRVVRSGGCRFCRMLAGRGAVYKDTTAHFASHGHCNCAAVPSWDQDAPEVDVEIYRASARTTGMSERQKAQHNALIRGALDTYT
jgi:hypothetical protein